MIKIKNIAAQSIRMGLYVEAEAMLRNLVDTQCTSLGLLHEETLNTIELWSETLALLEKWEHLDEVVELLSMARSNVVNTHLQSTLMFVMEVQGMHRASS